jgi:hypothetical protein
MEHSTDTPPRRTIRRPPIDIGGSSILAGTQRIVELPVASLPSGQPVTLSIHVVHGTQPGPTLWISGAVHGDEVIGIEIVRRVTETIKPRTLHGSLLAIHVVNPFGLLHQTRYLPDRRDLNRSFPGSARGSLGARLAALFMKEVVARSTHGIDLHSGTNHRTNLPQVRADLDDVETREMARAFGTSVLIDARTRDGSLRASAARKGARVLVYEGGEALRLHPDSVKAGVSGVRRVMHHLHMTRLPESQQEEPVGEPTVCTDSRWIRASRSGMFHPHVECGDFVAEKDIIGEIIDPFGRSRARVRTRYAGVVIGATLNPLVHQGDALMHIGIPSVK